MIVLCCYAQLHPATFEALPPGSILADVSGDATDYWRTLRGFWGKQEDLVIVEQDIVPPWNMLEQFAYCPEPWCVFPYAIDYDQMLCHSLGCTRFRREGNQAIQAQLSAAPHTWNECDGEIREAVLATGLEHPHVHYPAAVHLNPGIRQPADLEVLWQKFFGSNAENVPGCIKPPGCDGYVVHVSSSE